MSLTSDKDSYEQTFQRILKAYQHKKHRIRCATSKTRCAGAKRTQAHCPRGHFIGASGVCSLCPAKAQLPELEITKIY